MKVVEYVLSQPGLFVRLYAGRTHACFRLLRWLAEQDRPTPPECPVNVTRPECERLMRPQGVNGGRIGR